MKYDTYIAAENGKESVMSQPIDDKYNMSIEWLWVISMEVHLERKSSYFPKLSLESMYQASGRWCIYMIDDYVWWIIMSV